MFKCEPTMRHPRPAPDITSAHFHPVRRTCPKATRLSGETLKPFPRSTCIPHLTMSRSSSLTSLSSTPPKRPRPAYRSPISPPSSTYSSLTPVPSTPSLSPYSRHGRDPGSESEEEVETVEDPVWRQSQIQVTIHGTESEGEVEPFEKSDGLLERTEADLQMSYAIAPSEPDEANEPDIEGGHEQHSDTGHDYTPQADDIMDDDFVPLPPGTQSPELEHVPTGVEPIPWSPWFKHYMIRRIDWLDWKHCRTGTSSANSWRRTSTD